MEATKAEALLAQAEADKWRKEQAEAQKEIDIAALETAARTKAQSDADQNRRKAEEAERVAQDLLIQQTEKLN
jgi:hypothetical protein